MSSQLGTSTTHFFLWPTTDLRDDLLKAFYLKYEKEGSMSQGGDGESASMLHFMPLGTSTRLAWGSHLLSGIHISTSPQLYAKVPTLCTWFLLLLCFGIFVVVAAVQS